MSDILKIEMLSRAENEALARVAVATFMARMNPTLEEIGDVKTAVSEAVTNSVVHGYDNEHGIIMLEASIKDNILNVTIKDYGIGIKDIEQAREPLYTTKAIEERSGMGFTFMEIFMDNLSIESEYGKGTTIHMTKNILGGNK